MEVKNTQLNSKLTLIKGTCKNFRSIEDSVVEINYAEHSNLLVSSDTNGVAKSSLYLYLPYFALTGNSYKQGDPVDSLINTSKGKNLEVTLEFACAGKFYMIKRTRKPNNITVYNLVGDEYIEIEDQPVSSKDRQKMVYTLLNFNAKTAQSTIENTILLGSKFNGFLSMDASSRRDLIETVMDLGIFSTLNKETKALRGNLIAEQQQLSVDISNSELKEALAEQSVTHVKEEISTLERTHTEQLEVLNEKVNKCVADVETTLQLDTDGEDLHCAFEEDSEVIAKNKLELESKLNTDLLSLGEFEIDKNDSKLVLLESNYSSIDLEVELAKTQLKEKEDSLGSDVHLKIANIKATISEREEAYKTTLSNIESVYEEEHRSIVNQIKEQKICLEKEGTTLSGLKEKLASSEELRSDADILLVEAKTKEVKYQDTIAKMKENINYLLHKKAVEDNALVLLEHSGVCQSCRQEISEEYLIEARKDVQERLDSLQTELDVYYDRISKGEVAIDNLSIVALGCELEDASASVSSNTISVNESEGLCNSYLESLERLNNMQAECTRKYVQDKKDSELEFSNDILLLNNQLDSVEHEVSKKLGNYKAKLDQLLNTEGSRKEALLSQIEDRKVAMRGEHAGKESNLRGVYNAEVSALNSKLEHLTISLDNALKALLDNKNKAVTLAENNLIEANKSLEDLVTKYEANNLELRAKTTELVKKFNTISNKVKGLQDKYSANQLDIEDYDILLKLLSDQNGKASVVEYHLPLLNKSINLFLNKMGLYLDLEVDNVFNVTLNSVEYKSRNISSFSEGETAKLNLAIMLGLRQVSQGNNSISCNLLVLDECLERLHPTGVVDCVEMLKELFSDLNLVVITQRGEEFSEVFDHHKSYTKSTLIHK